MKKVILGLLFVLVLTLSACSSDGDEYSTDGGLFNKDKNDGNVEDQVIEILEDDEIYVFLNALPVDHTNIYIEQTVNVEMFDFVDGVYLVKNNEEIVGYIMTVTAEGRWGDIKYMIGISAIEDTIIQFEIIESQEQWGAFIETDSFKEQFVGKTSEHYLNSMYDLGVDGNTSATTTLRALDDSFGELFTMYNSLLK